MAGYPEGHHGHYEDGYGNGNGQDAYYQEEQPHHGYYDQGYDQGQTGNEGYYDEKYGIPSDLATCYADHPLSTYYNGGEHQGYGGDHQGYPAEGAYYDGGHQGYQDEYYNDQYYDQGGPAAAQQPQYGPNNGYA